jgi:hypothetical protein
MISLTLRGMRKRALHFGLICTGALGLLPAVNAMAADEVVVPEEMRKEVLKEKPKPQGFSNKLSIGSTGAYNHSSSVIGANDGSTVAIGVVIDAASEWVAGGFECLNTLKVQHTQTRTPQIPVFFKSADLAELVSTSIYRLKSVPWFGPYARARATTQLFNNYVIKAVDYEIKKTRLDGTSTLEKLSAQTNYQLSPAVNPLVLAETVGAFANPFESKAFTLKTKLGIGAQQVLSNDGFAVASDDAKTAKMEIKEIQAATQVGAEAEVAMAGDVTEGVAWKAKANVFMPAYSTAGKKTGLDAMTSDLGFGIGIKLAKWLSLDYTLTARRVPLILDDWQIQNGVMITAGFKL